MKGILADLLIKLGLDSKGLDNGLNNAKKKTDAFGDAIKKLGGILAGAFAVDRIIAFGKELIGLGGIAEGVRSAFMRMSDTQTLNELKNATKGTVSELELMKRAVQAQNLGLPIKNLSSLFEFATKRAQETGQSVDYLVDSIVLGIGRKSPLILDNLGISAIALKEKLKGVGMETASVSDIAAAVGEIAADSMKSSGKIIDTNAIKIQRLKSNWDNFKLSLAEAPELNESIGNWLDEINRQIKLLPSGLETSWNALTFVFGNRLKKMQPTEFVDIDPLTGKIKEAAKQQEILNDNTTEFNNLLGEVEISAEEYNKRVKEAFDNWDKNNQKLALHRELIDSINDSIADYEKKIKNFSGIDLSPKVADTSGITSSIQMFPLSDEKEQDLGFNTEAYKNMLDEFEQFKNDFKSLVVDFGVEVVDQFGQAIGTMIASGEFPDDFGKNVLGIIGGFISMLGKMLISLGVASEAFQALLNSAFSNPVSAGLAIAAGAALVLIGSAFQGAAKAGPTGSGSSGGGYISSPSYSNSSYGGSAARAENNTVEFVIKGNTLVGVLNNQSRKNGLIG